MKDVVFKNGTLLVNSDVAPDQVKSVIVSRKDGVFCEIFLRSDEKNDYEERWNELKETIKELRDNNLNNCNWNAYPVLKYLCNLMEVIEVHDCGEYRRMEMNDDLISRQVAIDAVAGWFFDTTDLRQPKEVLRCLPSAQLKIVRCKDCLMHGVCRFEQGLGLDGYCSQAKRRTNGVDS